MAERDELKYHTFGRSPSQDMRSGNEQTNGTLPGSFVRRKTRAGEVELSNQLSPGYM